MFALKVIEIEKDDNCTLSLFPFSRYFVSTPQQFACKVLSFDKYSYLYL